MDKQTQEQTPEQAQQHRQQRRHDIDALRALAFGAVMVFHLGMAYVAGWAWHLKSEYAVDWLQWPMRALSLFRLDLVFLISGLSLSFLTGSTNTGCTNPARARWGVLRQRTLRLLLPLAFGMAVVVPYQPYAQGLANGLVQPGFGAFLLRYYSGGPWPPGAFDGWQFGVTWNHLWYLAYLWLYTAVLLLALPLLQSTWGQRLRARFCALSGWRLMVLPALPLMAYSLTLWPWFKPTHDLLHDAWLHAVYFSLFLYGWWLGLDARLWQTLLHSRQRALVLALGLFVLYVSLLVWAQGTVAGAPMAARLVADLTLWAAVLALLGYAYRYLNAPWPWLAWARETVYPWYVLHQTLLIVALSYVAPLRLGAGLEPLVVLSFTVLGCWALSDGLIRRWRWLRPLFGLAARPR